MGLSSLETAKLVCLISSCKVLPSTFQSVAEVDGRERGEFIARHPVQAECRTPARQLETISLRAQPDGMLGKFTLNERLPRRGLARPHLIT